MKQDKDITELEKDDLVGTINDYNNDLAKLLTRFQDVAALENQMRSSEVEPLTFGNEVNENEHPETQ